MIILAKAVLILVKHALHHQTAVQVVKTLPFTSVDQLVSHLAQTEAMGTQLIKHAEIVIQAVLNVPPRLPVAQAAFHPDF